MENPQREGYQNWWFAYLWQCEKYGDYCLFPIKAVSTYLTWLYADRSQQVVQTVEVKSCKVQFFFNIFQHLFVILGIRICIGIQNLPADIVSFPFGNDPSGDQIHLG